MRCIYKEYDVKGGAPYRPGQPLVEVKVYVPDYSYDDVALPDLIQLQDGVVSSSGEPSYKNTTWTVMDEQFMPDAKLIREAQSMYDELKERVFKGGD